LPLYGTQLKLRRLGIPSTLGRASFLQPCIRYGAYHQGSGRNDSYEETRLDAVRGSCSYMISWSSQIWFLSPLKFFFYVFVFFSSKVQVRTSFYFLYYFFCSYMCFLSMPLFFVTETWWKWNQVISLYSLSISFLSFKLVVRGNLLS